MEVVFRNRKVLMGCNEERKEKVTKYMAKIDKRSVSKMKRNESASTVVPAVSVAAANDEQVSEGTSKVALDLPGETQEGGENWN